MNEEAVKVLEHHRRLINRPTPHALNETISQDFFAVFDLGNGPFETYACEQYRSGNFEAYKYYEGKDPYWEYQTLEIGVRSETEFVASSRIDFSLGGTVIMKALCMEVYRKEDGEWRILRQYMEKFRL